MIFDCISVGGGVVGLSSIINLPSSDFQKIIRDLSQISDKLEIKSIANELVFKCRGPFA